MEKIIYLYPDASNFNLCECSLRPGLHFLLSGPSLTMTKNSDTRVTRGP